MRYLIISDVHANQTALSAVLDDAGSYDSIWCLGDLVGYGPDPNECVERLRELAHLSLAGNHDWAALGKLDIMSFNSDARAASIWTSGELSRSSRKFLDALPTDTVKDQFTLAHGSPRQPVWEYVLYPSIAQPNFKHFGTQFCFVGHTHTPVIFQLAWQEFGEYCELIPPTLDGPIPLGKQRLIMNPGSVGQPRDGDRRASYALLDLEHLTIEYRRIPYPIDETQRRMEEADLPVRLISRLSFGW